MPNTNDKVNGITTQAWHNKKSHNDRKHIEVSRIAERDILRHDCGSGCSGHTGCRDGRTVTFMISGDICSRGCKICTAAMYRPLPTIENEPRRFADFVCPAGLRQIAAAPGDSRPNTPATLPHTLICRHRLPRYRNMAGSRGVVCNVQYGRRDGKSAADGRRRQDRGDI